MRAWSGDSERTIAIPLRVSASNARSPACGPELTWQGSVPRNAGVSTTWSPSTKQWRLRWCPSSCHPHGSSSDGAPKMLRKYAHSPYSSRLSVISARTSLKRMTVRTSSKPRALKLARMRSSAASR